MKRGGITVFLSLILLLVFAFLCSMIESARIQGVRMQLETAADISIESVFAQFNRELHEQYDVFFFDGSYGKRQISRQFIEDRIVEYMDYNIHPTKELFLKTTDFNHITQTSSDLHQMALATDDNGYVFRNAAIDYVKNKTWLTVMENLMSDYQWANNNMEKEGEFERKEKEVGEALVLLEGEKSAVDEEKKEEADQAKRQENPIASVEQIKSMGILELVCNDTANISQKSISLPELPSHRTLNKGSGLEKYETDIASEILFGSYILQQFPSAVNTLKENIGNLQYQIEYVLMGKEHDVDNLKAVVNRLLLMREGVNFAYLLTDNAKMAEAELLAMALVGYTGIVPLIEATKISLLLAWAYAESVSDIKILLEGGKIALIKTNGNWKMSLAKIGKSDSLKAEEKGDSNGLSYKEYLRLLLLIGDKKKIALRCLDIIEMNIRQTKGNQNLKMDYCVSKLNIVMAAETKSMFYSLPFMRWYSYSFKKGFEVSRTYEYNIGFR